MGRSKVYLQVRICYNYKFGDYMHRIALTIAICAVFFVNGNVFAASGYTTDPADIGVGARPLGMGKAYVGFSGDANSLFINPAGLAKADSLKITSMSGQVLQEINYLVFGAAYPYDFGTLGIGYINVGLPDIPVTMVTGSGTTAAVVPIGATNYNASVLLLSYSNDVKKMPLMEWAENATYGINIKYFAQGFIGGGSALDDANGTGWDMDLGLQYKPNKPWTLGISFINVLPESMGGKFVWVRNNVTEDIPTTVKLGVKTKIWGSEDSIYGGSQDLYVGVDADYFSEANKPAVLHIGTEWWPSDILAIRLGVDQKPRGSETGIGVDNNYTAGIGIKAHGYTFDYCYHQFSDLPENVTHFFSIGYVGLEDKKPEIVEEPKVILPVVVPRPNLKTFSDIPDGYWAKGPIEFMATLGVMNGYEDGTFRPDKTVSRAEMAKMLISLKEMEPNEALSDPYPDVPKDNWSAKYIKAASYLRFMNAYPDGTFQPDKLVDRTEAVVTITRLEAIQPPKEVERSPYPDVSSHHWAAGVISIAKEKGYLDYLPSNKNFEMNKLITRAELAEMLSKTEYGRKRIKKLLED